MMLTLFVLIAFFTGLGVYYLFWASPILKENERNRTRYTSRFTEHDFTHLRKNPLFLKRFLDQYAEAYRT